MHSWMSRYAEWDAVNGSSVVACLNQEACSRDTISWGHVRCVQSGMFCCCTSKRCDLLLFIPAGHSWPRHHSVPGHCRPVVVRAVVGDGRVPLCARTAAAPHYAGSKGQAAPGRGEWVCSTHCVRAGVRGGTRGCVHACMWLNVLQSHWVSRFKRVFAHASVLAGRCCTFWIPRWNFQSSMYV